jgi:hypothetical protein
MLTRTRSESVVFNHPFELKGVDRVLPSGHYRVVTDEELIEELSFPVYRRVATAIFVPAQSHRTSSIEMVAIDPLDLRAAQDRDGAERQNPCLTWTGPVAGVSEAEPRTRHKIMTEKTIDLDHHRGMAAQKATDLRRMLSEVEANERALRLRQDELETHLLAAPAANWHEAAEKARYLLNLFAATLTTQDPRRQKLIATVLADFERLAAES